MAGSMTDYAENALLNHLLGGSATPAVGSVYIGLWTATLSDTSTGSTAGEVSGGAYARATVPCNDTNWNWATAALVDNRPAISFGTATADWGTVTHGGVCDAAAAGNMLYWWDWSASKIIQNGDPVTIQAGALDISQT